MTYRTEFLVLFTEQRGNASYKKKWTTHFLRLHSDEHLRTEAENGIINNKRRDSMKQKGEIKVIKNGFWQNPAERKPQLILLNAQTGLQQH